MSIIFTELKLVLAAVAALLGVLSYVPYVRSIVRGDTKPHPYTWLIWTLTTGTAAFGAWYGGGGYGGLTLVLWTVLTFCIFLFSLKYGTKNVTKSDIALLALALLSIFVWWQLHSPLLSVLMVTAIDAFGYIPTFRKSLKEPWSESVFSWFLFLCTASFSLLALTHYNVLTVTYLAMSASLNLVVILICLLRRQSISKPVAEFPKNHSSLN